MSQVSIVPRTYHEYGDPNKPERTDNEVYLNGKPFVMGDGTASAYLKFCEVHGGERWHISGYNQGGNDGMDICLDCAAEIQYYFRYEHKE